MDSHHPVSRSERPSTVEALFLTGVGPDGGFDPARLEALCAERPDLAPELRALAARHARAGELLAALSRASGATPGGDGRAALRFSERYEVLGEIARGGMGVVLEVWDAKLRRRLAMKALRRDRDPGDPELRLQLERRRARLVNEAQVLAQLEHPGIVPVHDVGLDDCGETYVTMLLVRGQSLAEVFAAVRAKRDGWSLTRAVGVLLRVSEAVAYAHEKGVLHRDLKPSNVMVGAFGEAYVMDWGLARASTGDLRAGEPEAGDGAPVNGRSTHASKPGDSIVRTNRSDERASDSSSPLLTQEGEVVGTPAYMSPEQARGRFEEVDARSDIYSLGAMLYELLAGAAPYSSELRDSPPHTVLAASRARAPQPIEAVAPRAPAELAAIAAKAMARERERRYASVGELAGDLRAYLEGRVVRAHRTGALIELYKWIGRNRGAAAAIAAVVVGLAATATVQSLLKRDVQRAQLETAARAEALRRQDYVHKVALASASFARGDTRHARELLEDCPEDLRRWEWRYLSRHSDTSERVLELPDSQTAKDIVLTHAGCTAVVTDWGPSGSRIALWDGEAARVLADGLPLINNLALSADGTLLAGFGMDMARGRSEMHLWRVEDWRPLPVLDVQMNGWQQASFAPRGHLLAAYGMQGVQLWDVDRRELVSMLSAGQAEIADVGWSGDGSRLYAASWDGSISVWDVEQADLVDVLRASTWRMQSVAASPDGRWIAGGDWSRHFYVWDARTLELAHRSDRLNGIVWSVDWSPDSTLLAVAGEGCAVELFEAGTWILRGRLTGNSAPVGSVRFVPGTSLVATASSSGEARIWDLARPDWRSLHGEQGRDIASVSISPDVRRVAVAVRHRGIELWTCDTQSIETTLTAARPARGMAWSPDGACLAVAEADGVTLIDPARDQVVLRLAADSPKDVHFDSAGRRIAAIGDDGYLRLWDTQSGEALWSARVGDRPYSWPGASGACWSHDEREILAMGFGGRLEIHAAQTGELLRWRELPGMSHAAFAKGGTCILIGGPPGTQMLDAGRLEPVWSNNGLVHGFPVCAAAGGRAFSILGMEGGLGVLDLDTGHLSARIPTEANYGASDVSSDGEIVVVASVEGVAFFDARARR